MSQHNPDKEIELRPDSRKSQLFGLLLLVFAVTGYVVFLRPLSAQIDTLKTDLVTKTGQVDTLKLQIDEFEKAEKELELGTEVQRLEILKAVPTQLDQDEVIRDIVDIAETYDIELKSISFGKGGTKHEGVGALRISASFEGNYTDLTDFLEGLEQNARLFKVDSISVQINKLDITDIERANFALTIESFFQQ